MLASVKMAGERDKKRRCRIHGDASGDAVIMKSGHSQAYNRRWWMMIHVYARHGIHCCYDTMLPHCIGHQFSEGQSRLNTSGDHHSSTHLQDNFSHQNNSIWLNIAGQYGWYHINTSHHNNISFITVVNK